MGLNAVDNNAPFSRVAVAFSDSTVAEFNLRAQLESSTLAGGPRVDSALRPMGAGINADYKA
jgi:hypothetical protein